MVFHKELYTTVKHLLDNGVGAQAQVTYRKKTYFSHLIRSSDAVPAITNSQIIKHHLIHLIPCWYMQRCLNPERHLLTYWITTSELQ